MESNYRNKDFEEYVKENADQYRMFPSEKVWKNIHGTLHTRRKWYGFGLGFLLLLTGTAVTWVMLSYPVSKNQAAFLDKPADAPAQEPFSVSKSVAAHENMQPATIIPLFSNSPATSLKPVAEVQTVVTTIEVGSPVPEPQNNTTAVSPEQLPVIKTDKTALSVNETDKTVNPVSPLLLLPAAPSYEPAKTPVLPQVSQTEKPGLPIISSGHGETKYPLTIESVTNAFQHNRIKQISWQLFVTPTISYRKLDENKTFENPGNLSYPFASLTDVNKAVTHKPDMGLQVGLSAGYPVTRNIKIRGGLQFNINRYDIKAFPYNPEIATINLSDPSGISSVSAWTPYRNYGSLKSDWLKNFYFSVSAPIGVELRLFGNEKTNFGIATTLQPTYIIKDRAYLISTDYKNYAEVPWLIRHVNVNTGFETFVNYTNGRTRWQIGPQVRYQVLSSFHNKYPVKENLFDFGIKVGVSLNE